jgi:hypothetical protein
MLSFCQSLTEKHSHPRSQIDGIELARAKLSFSKPKAGQSHFRE